MVQLKILVVIPCHDRSVVVDCSRQSSPNTYLVAIMKKKQEAQLTCRALAGCAKALVPGRGDGGAESESVMTVSPVRSTYL